ncbi:GNAT family N-acetyltransferase [Plantactinospora endophytica]|uniref:GCN5 family acetyltransferase n=1 Tax=Plantactinospora endophytica TaxID=673535 RepID=A0ABQ4DWM6_9ACTN|nr:GNAT family N-acetyltransferase [Plantactinospora endophytica]GIG86857.1 GCN5 family acetyltransferase [Plantactinospora endophytica]
MSVPPTDLTGVPPTIEPLTVSPAGVDDPGEILTVGPAGVDDPGEILTVQRAAYLSEAQRYRDPMLPPLTETLTEIRAVLAGVPETGVVLVARLGTRIVGAVRAGFDGGTARVGRLAVAPDLQGRGVGSHLLRAVEAACPDRVRRFELFTGADSADNLRLYRRHGYLDYAHRPLDTGPGLVYLEKYRSRAGG